MLYKTLKILSIVGLYFTLIKRWDQDQSIIFCFLYDSVKAVHITVWFCHLCCLSADNGFCAIHFVLDDQYICHFNNNAMIFGWFGWYTVLNATFNNISVNFIGGNRRTRRKPPTCRNSSPTNFIT